MTHLHSHQSPRIATMKRFRVAAFVAACVCLVFPAAFASEGRPRIIKFDPAPAKIDFDSARTAVVVVDMQNDFCSPGGLLDRLGMDLSEIQRTIGPTARVLTSARKAGLPIVYLKMAFKPDLSDLGREGSPNRMGHMRAGAGKTISAPDGSTSRILIRDTWDTGHHPRSEVGTGRHLDLQEPLQWFCWDRTGLGPEELGRIPAYFHRCNHECLRRIHDSRRHVPGLLLRAAIRLHCRTSGSRIGPH